MGLILPSVLMLVADSKKKILLAGKAQFSWKLFALFQGVLPIMGVCQAAGLPRTNGLHSTAELTDTFVF